jgi:uncharacterized protein DUF4384
MIRNIVILGFVIALAGFNQVPTFAQQDEDVRGSFMTTRPTASNKPPTSGPAIKPSRRRPKTRTQTFQVTTTGTIKNTSGTTVAIPVKTTDRRLGLGMTLFKRDPNGMTVRADPSQEFRKGDHVRVLLETNADGYLYVFNTTNGGAPVMIYPDPELDDAGNFVRAHVPFELPSSVAPEERLRWFTFDQNAGIEKLYFVFTREPLATIPIEDDLVTFCRNRVGQCPWHPGNEIWALIQRESGEAAPIAKVEVVGSVETSSEHQAATRGIGLNREDPEPSLIILTASTNKNVLVASMELIHRSVGMAVDSNAGAAVASRRKSP